MPRVSVVLAVYNGESYLREAIDSILGQSFDDFEFLIVDDGSTDTTATILRSYSDSRIRIMRNGGNRGLTRSLNRALTVARGEYIARQDADDVSEPDRLRQQVEYLERHPSIALLGTSYTLIDRRGDLLAHESLPTDDLDLRWEMFFSCPFIHSSVMWRRELIREHIGAYDESLDYAQDNDLWIRVAARFRVANLPAFLVRYRDHAASMTMTYGDRTNEAGRLWLAAVTEALDWTSAPRVREAHFAAMIALLDARRPRALTGAEASRAATHVLTLASVFNRRNALQTAQAQRHGRRLRATIALGLVRLGARGFRDRRLKDVREMLAAAHRLYPAVGALVARRVAARTYRRIARLLVSR